VSYLCDNIILVFLGISILDLGPMYPTDVRQTDVRRQTAYHIIILQYHIPPFGKHLY